jgi:hypothetical protein
VRDANRLFKSSGTVNCYLRLENAEDVDKSAVQELSNPSAGMRSRVAGRNRFELDGD